MKMKEWIGRHVRLRRRTETRGGHIFEAGEIMVVASTWRGKLALFRPSRDHHTDEHGGAQGIRGVARCDVDLMAADPVAVVRACLDSALKVAEAHNIPLDPEFVTTITDVKLAWQV